jgi:hypothetical protein
MNHSNPKYLNFLKYLLHLVPLVDQLHLVPPEVL